jgi:hypothetical protein
MCRIGGSFVMTVVHHMMTFELQDTLEIPPFQYYFSNLSSVSSNDTEETVING